MTKDRWKGILIGGKIRFTQPMYLNDPFECSPNILGLLEAKETESTFENVIEEEAKRFISPFPESYRDEAYNIFMRMVSSRRSEAKSFYETMSETAVSLVADALKKFISDNGMLCLTQRYKNLLMWSHYAHEHTGLVIGFDTRHKCLDQKEGPNDEFYHPRKVVYSTKKARPSTHLGNVDFENIFLTKSREWRYEQEWRITTPTARGECFFNQEIQQLICLFPMDIDAVKRIYLGAKMPAENRDEITQCLRNTQDKHNIKLFAAELHPENFELMFKQVDYRSA